MTLTQPELGSRFAMLSLPDVFRLSIRKYAVEVQKAPENPLDTVKIQRQCDDEWCWAAVAVTVALYYDSTRDIDQCWLASTAKGQTCCSSAGLPVACQSPHDTADAIAVAGHLSKRDLGSMILLDVVLHEYEGERPLACRMAGWITDSGKYIPSHAILVVGSYREDGKDWIRVLDPLGGGCVTERELGDFRDMFIGCILTDKDP